MNKTSFAGCWFCAHTAPAVTAGVATFDFSITDVTASGATNIKLLEVVILAPPNTGDTPIPVAKLRAYTTNVGEVDYAKRRF